jgi:hypothetical protein
VFLLPVRWLATAASEAWLIAPRSTNAWLWIAAVCAAALLVAAHILLAMVCSAGFCAFMRPIHNWRIVVARLRYGEFWRTASEALDQFLGALRLLYHLRLASIAYTGVYLWVSIPTLMFTIVADSPGQWERLVTAAGGVCLVAPLTCLPMLVTHAAATGRLGALFELRTIRELFNKSPFLFTIATIATYASAFASLFYCARWKVLVPPHETMWDVMIVFLLAAYPARVILGWAYHRGKIGRQSWWGWRCVNLVFLLAGVGVYVFLLSLVQTSALLGWQAVWQHHALLLTFPLPLP